MSEKTLSKCTQEPEIFEATAKPIAALYAKVPSKEIQGEMGQLVKELFDVLSSQGVKPTGRWFTHHFHAPGEFFDFEVCVAVDSPIKASGRVKPSQWPATKMVRTTYHGGYHGLGGAWQEFMGNIQALGLNVSPEIWEVYLVGPDTTPDQDQWQTELNRAVI